MQSESSLTPATESNPHRSKPSRFWAWALAFSLLVAVTTTVLFIVMARAEPMLNAYVIETLSTHFKSKVELDTFHVSVLKGLQVSGRGLRLFGAEDPNNHEPGVQPLIAVAEFRFGLGVRNLFQRPIHISTVYVSGLRLNLPPRERRTDIDRFGNRGKVEIVVDKFLCHDAQLVINTLKPGKLPLEFDISNLTMTSTGPGGPLHFDANLVNPKPVGEILSSGSFGPWQADNPRATPVSGSYRFDHADLATIKGIGGILSSTGSYSGVLEKIAVDGSTDTPNFSVAVSGRPVPLHTDFHAIVDGINGDTHLESVKARILDTSMTASGSVVRERTPPGHRVQLDVVIGKGRIEDLLKLGVRTDPPVVMGTVQLKTQLDLPPGEPDVANRLKLIGNFHIQDARFTNETVQSKVVALSMRSQGKPKLAKTNNLDNVQSDLQGQFDLNTGLLTFSELQFEVPGTRVNLTGTYSLDGNQFDFHGKARMDAKVSQMLTGWKSVLLKPVDPFFSKHGAGTEVPIKVTGTKSQPHFGVDFGHDPHKHD